MNVTIDLMFFSHVQHTDFVSQSFFFLTDQLQSQMDQDKFQLQRRLCGAGVSFS